jgi:hypothetical protein
MRIVCAVPDVIVVLRVPFPAAQSGSASSGRQRDQALIRLIATMNLWRYGVAARTAGLGQFDPRRGLRHGPDVVNRTVQLAT